MKKNYTYLILFLLVTNVLSAQVDDGALYNANIVKNFHFAAGSDANWDHWGNQPSFTAFERFDGRANVKGIGAIYQELEVIPNTDYVLKVAMFVKPNTRMFIGVHNAGENRNEQYIEIVAPSDSRFIKNYYVNVTSGDSNTLVVYAHYPDADSEATIASFAFGTLAETTYPNLVKNPSFETGEFSDWAYWRNAPISLGLLKNRYDGNKGVRVNGQASLYQNIETVPGKKYKLTAFSRPEAGSYVNIGLKPAQEKREPYVSNSDSSDWTKSEIIFTASETTTLIYAYIPREGDSAVVDNFIVQELPNQGDVVVKAKSFETNNIEVTAYPNPSSNGLFTINNTSGYKMIRVYSLTGAKVFEKTINKVKNVKVDLSGLSGEFFMVKLDNSEMLRVVKK